MESTIRSKLAHVPKEPGVYFMKDARGHVLYVGKAKDLRSRVASYFNDNKDHSPKTRKLVRAIHDFEIMLVKTEVEALLLERTLIKHHQPTYNILLRDDKEYPYVRIHFKEDWPRINVVRRRKDDGATYFGPFGSPGSLRQSLEAVNKVFPLIRCSPWEFKNAKRVCNYFHMKLCLGPCVNSVDPEVYRAMLKDAMGLLQGHGKELLQTLTERMKAASDKELYELAAQYRDQIQAMGSLAEKQSVMVDPEIQADVIAWCSHDEFNGAHVLKIRDGRVMGGDSFALPNAMESTLEEAIAHFILQYYDGRDVPRRILVPVELPDGTALASAITENTQQQTVLVYAGKSKQKPWPELIAIAERNAQYTLDEANRVQDHARSSLDALQKTLSLAQSPKRIECIDISNLQGTAIVASDVCFVNGHPEKSQYRSYNIETVQGAPDDFASIFEVVKRRLVRGVRDGDMPDLLVIDGGRGQLDAALKAQSEFPGLELTIVGLAKSRVQKNKASTKYKIDSSAPRHSLERVFTPGADHPIPLLPGSPAFRILTRIRDEAHRFAITHHRRKRAAAGQQSALENIPGVGPKLRVALLTHFGNMEEIARAPLDELRKIKGISADLATRIHVALKI